MNKITEKLTENSAPDFFEMVAARALHLMFTNYNMDYEEIANELGIDVQVVLDLIGPDSYEDDAYDDKDIMLEAAIDNVDTDNIKGVKTITIHNDTDEKVVLKFNTFAEAAKHFDNLYMNAVEDNYAEEVLYPILSAANEEEYDYIDDEGYAVIEVDATGIFESCASNKKLKESYRRIVSRGKSFIENELFVDFD